MIRIVSNPDISELSTFMVKAQAKKIVYLESEADLSELVNYLKGKDYYILGGGSNTLFESYVDKILVKVDLMGIREISNNDEFVEFAVMAGENWDSFVNFTIEQNLGGIENMIYVPGSVGGAAVQQIGAYGQEIKETLTNVRALNVDTGEVKTFANEECGFDYRFSEFKAGKYTNYIVLEVSLKLHKNPKPNLSYARLAEFFTQAGIEKPTIRGVADQVKKTRQANLPDVGVIGSAGSFFINPVLTAEQFEAFHGKFPDAVSFEFGEKYKVGAAWLIDQAGWKGYRVDDYGVYDKHALVLVNYGETEGDQIVALAQDIIDDVEAKFGITLTPEIKIVR